MSTQRWTRARRDSTDFQNLRAFGDGLRLQKVVQVGVLDGFVKICTRLPLSVKCYPYTYVRRASSHAGHRVLANDYMESTSVSANNSCKLGSYLRKAPFFET